MNIQAEKLHLIQQLVQVDDENLLQAIKNLLEFGLKRQSESHTDFWEELTEEQKAKVESSILQLEDGHGIPHEEVMSALRKKYGA
jgi:signal transduction histidine kinase